jgi:O-antigen/teichoic acid export membrane protein
MLFFAACVVLFVHSADDLIRVGIIEVAAAAVMASYFLFLQFRESIPVRIRLNMRKSQALIAMAFPVGASNMVWAINQYLPTLSVAYFVGGLAVAWMGAAHRIVNAVISFSMVYHFNLFPTISRRLMDSDESFKEIVNPSFRVTAWAGIGIATVISLLSAPICTVVFGKEFGSASTTLAILIWSLPLTLLNGHARWALIARNKQRYVLYAQSAGTLTTVIACLLLIPRFGPEGGATAMVCCSGVVWIVAHVNATRHVAPIPSLNLAWRPAVLAFSTFAAVEYFTIDSLTGVVLAILGFFLIAPVIDRSLPGDIHKISRVKNVQKGK